MLSTYTQNFFISVDRAISAQPSRAPPDPDFLRDFFINLESECSKRKSPLELPRDVIAVWLPKIIQLINSCINPTDMHCQKLIINIFIGAKSVDELYQYLECYHSVNPLRRPNVNKKKDLSDLKKVFAILLDEIAKADLLKLLQFWCQQDRSDVIEYIRDTLYVLYPDILGPPPPARSVAAVPRVTPRPPTVLQPAAQHLMIQPPVFKDPPKIPQPAVKAPLPSKPVVKAPLPSKPQPSPSPQLKPSPAIPQPVNNVPLVKTPTTAPLQKNQTKVITPAEESVKTHRTRGRSTKTTSMITAGPRPSASSENTARDVGFNETIENAVTSSDSRRPRGERRLTGRGTAAARDFQENRPPKNAPSKAIPAIRERDRHRDLHAKHPQNPGSLTNKTVKPTLASEAVREPKPPKKAQNAVNVPFMFQKPQDTTNSAQPVQSPFLDHVVNVVDFQLDFDIPDPIEEEMNVRRIASVPVRDVTPDVVPKENKTDSTKTDLSKVKLEPLELPAKKKHLKRGPSDDGEIEVVMPYKLRAAGLATPKKAAHQNVQPSIDSGGITQIKLGLYIDPALDDPALFELPIAVQYRFVKTNSLFPSFHSCKTMIYFVKDKDALNNEDLPEGITMLMVFFDAKMKGHVKKVPGHKGPTGLIVGDVRVMVEEMNNRRLFDKRVAKKELKMAQKKMKNNNA